MRDLKQTKNRTQDGLRGRPWLWFLCLQVAALLFSGSPAKANYQGVSELPAATAPSAGRAALNLRNDSGVTSARNTRADASPVVTTLNATNSNNVVPGTISTQPTIFNAPTATTLPNSPAAAAPYVNQIPVNMAPIVPLMMPQPQQMDPNLIPMLAQLASQAIMMATQQNKRPSADYVSEEYTSDSSGAYDSGAQYDQEGAVVAQFERLEQINSNNTAPAELGGGSIGVPPPACTTCLAPTQQDARFQTCKESNGFFEDFLARAGNPGLASLANYTPKPSTVSCIAQNIPMVRTSNYRYCESGSGTYGEKVERPCASEKMVKALSSAFELTTECLAGYMDPRAETDPEAKASMRRAFFQLISHESGWSMNAVSHTGAGGLGQMTQGAIEDVNTRELPDIMARVKGSPNPACQALAKTNYPVLDGGRDNACERVTMSNGNPQLNLMYTLGHLKMVRSAIEGQIDALNLAPNIRAQLIDQVMIWGHNVGSGGIAPILRITISKQTALLRSGNVGEFLVKMKDDVRSWHAANSRRNATEPTQFLAQTQDRLKTLETSVNGKCGVVN